MHPLERSIDIGIVVLVEHIQRRTQSPGQDGWVLRDDRHSRSQIRQTNFGDVFGLVSSSRLPTLNLPMPSIVIRPLVASTKRKKLSAKVDFPHPVEPTIPIFSLGETEKLIPCSTSGRSGCISDFSPWSPYGTYGITNDELLDSDRARFRPGCGRTRLDELRRLLPELGVPVISMAVRIIECMCSLLDPLQRNHALLELHETPHDEQQVVRNGRSESERETGLRSGDRWREKDYHSCEAQDDSGEDIEPRRKPSVDRPIDQCR